MKQAAIYIMTNKKFGTLYIGVTSNLAKRVFEHKSGVIEGFTHRYHCKMLVYYYFFSTMIEAITAEKKLKNSSRFLKIQLIESYNSEWKDLPLE